MGQCPRHVISQEFHGGISVHQIATIDWQGNFKTALLCGVAESVTVTALKGEGSQQVFPGGEVNILPAIRPRLRTL